MKYLCVLGATVLSAFGGYYLKKASGAGRNLWKLLLNKYLWIGGILYIISSAFTIMLLQVVDYAVALPLGSLTYVWSLFIAHKLLGEKITKRRVAGICCIVSGVLMIALS